MDPLKNWGTYKVNNFIFHVNAKTKTHMKHHEVNETFPPTSSDARGMASAGLKPWPAPPRPEPQKKMKQMPLPRGRCQKC